MTEIEFAPMHDLAVQAFKSSEGKELFDKALAEEKAKTEKMYSSLMDGSIDFYVQKDEASAVTGKSLISAWTRSARHDGVQHTTFLCRDNEFSVISLSHEDIRGADEMYSDACPDEGTVYGISLKDNDLCPIELYMINVEDPDWDLMQNSGMNCA